MIELKNYEPLPEDAYLVQIARELLGLNANAPGASLIHARLVLAEALDWVLGQLECKADDHERNGVATGR